MRKIIDRWAYIVIIMTSLLVVPTLSLWADESTTKLSPASLENIGFVKNPSKALQEKFPMCDAFLKVEWIDNEKKIGYSNYLAASIDDNGKLEKERKMVWALVHLGDISPAYSYDIYQYLKNNRMDELFEMIRKGSIAEDQWLFAIRYKGKLTEFYGVSSRVLSDFQQTVCIVYPDGKRALIIEGKSVDNSYLETERKIVSGKIKKAVNKFNDKWFGSLWVLDINFDGDNDFFKGESVKYSSNGNYYGMERIEVQDTFGRWRFPSSNKECMIKPKRNYYLTTDGKHYFFCNQCNLNELIISTTRE